MSTKRKKGRTYEKTGEFEEDIDEAVLLLDDPHKNGHIKRGVRHEYINEVKKHIFRLCFQNMLLATYTFSSLTHRAEPFLTSRQMCSHSRISSHCKHIFLFIWNSSVCD
jgi:hypothetical protein